MPFAHERNTPVPILSGVRVVDAEDQRRLLSIMAYDVCPGSARTSWRPSSSWRPGSPACPRRPSTSSPTPSSTRSPPSASSRGVPPRGLDVRGHPAQAATPVVLDDAQEDLRFARQPVRHRRAWRQVRFYATYPLVTREGVPIGTLCVFDERAARARRRSPVGPWPPWPTDRRHLRAAAAQPGARRCSLTEVQAVRPSSSGPTSGWRRSPARSATTSRRRSPRCRSRSSLIREQLEDGESAPESSRLLDRAINGSARMADLIDDVLDYARLGGTLKATEVDLDFVLGEVLEDLGSDLDGVDAAHRPAADRPRRPGPAPGGAAEPARQRREVPRPGAARRRHRLRAPRAARLADRGHRQRPRRPRRPSGSGSSSRWPGSTTPSTAPASAWPPAAGSSVRTAARSASTRDHRRRPVLVRAA